MTSQEPFDPVGFWECAQRLIEDDPGEADIRTAVGRTYYAAYLLLTPLVAPHLPAGKRPNHKSVISAVGINLRQSMQGRLAQLYGLRCAADYQVVPKSRQHQDWFRNWSVAQQSMEPLLADIREHSVR